MRFYTYNLSNIFDWMKENGVKTPEDITSRYVRAYLAEMEGNGLSDSYIHSHARIIKTFTHFLLQEGYIEKEIKFTMPKIEKKRLKILSADELQKVLEKLRSTPQPPFFDEALLKLSKKADLFSMLEN